MAQLPNAQAFDRCDKSVATLRAGPEVRPPYRFVVPEAPVAAAPTTEGGVLYFGCHIANHCVQGQKIRVNVVPAGMAFAPAPGLFGVAAAAPAPYGMAGRQP